MNYIKYIVSLTIIVCLIGLFTGLSYAGIGAQPDFQEFTGNPGEKIEGVYSVYNTGDKPLKVEVYYKDHFKLDENKAITAQDWISCEEKEFILGAGETKEVKFTAIVPAKAFAEVMGMIFFSGGSVQGAGVKMSYGVPVYVRIKDTALVKGDIKSVELQKIIKTPKDVPPRYKALVRLENTGNVHLRPEVKIKVYKEDKFVKNILFPFGKPIFPTDSFNYQSSWEVSEWEIPEGHYKGIVQVSLGEENIVETETGFTVTKDGSIKMD